jgi:hypothetical protein
MTGRQRPHRYISLSEACLDLSDTNLNSVSGHDDFMAQFQQLLADPDRVRSGFHRHARWRHIRKPFRDALGSSSETASIDYFAVFVESAVVAPDITKINAHRQLDPGLPAWDFYDEVLRYLLHGKQSLPPGRPAHPISRYQSLSR